MNLQRASEPAEAAAGLWVNTDWVADTPGTFAVVIGVSRYDHLLNGPGSIATKHFGLTQLYVSAYTAHQVFTWLRDEYSYANCPLAKCWLLLSPGPEELHFDAALGTVAPDATWSACQAAIQTWFLTMKALPSVAQQQSRAFFFFCGHGFEIGPNQILLPSDYMQPPLEHADLAVNTSNLVTGMAALEVPHQLFFPDACRSDHEDLRRENVTGTKILPESPTHRSNLARTAPIVYATAAGTTSWQPNDPAIGQSLYGEALLDGLRGRPNLALDSSGEYSEVKIYPLQKYLDSRIPDLLQTRYNAKVLQPIRLGGVVGDATVTQLGKPVPPLNAFPWLSLFDESVPLLASKGPSLQALIEASFPLESDHIEGSESMFALWETVEVYSLDRREWLPDDRVSVHHVRRDEDTRAYRVAFSVDSTGDHWLQFSDQERRFACLLAGDPDYAPIYTLELTREYRENDSPRVTQLTASLALDNPYPFGQVADLWEWSCRNNVAALMEGVDGSFPHDEFSSALAGTIAGLILLRARRADFLGDLLRGLGERLAEQADGAVLLTEYLLLQTSAMPYPPEATTRLLTLRRRGLPRTAESFGYAFQQVDDILRYGEPEADQVVALEGLREQLIAGSRFFRAGGLFSAFADSTGVLSVELVEGMGIAARMPVSV